MLPKAVLQRLQQKMGGASGEATPEDGEPEEETKGERKAKPRMTRAQIELERARQRQQREEEAKEALRKRAVERLRAENSELVDNFDRLSGDVKTATQSKDEKFELLKSQVEKLVSIDPKGCTADIAAKVGITLPETVEQEEALDDWDVEEPEDSPEVAELKSSVNSLYADVLKLEAQVTKAVADFASTQLEYNTKVNAKVKEILAEEAAEKRRQEEAEAARIRALKEAEEKASTHLAGSNLRSPIGVVLGHVDSGKTSLLDKIRNSSVQRGEAGGITQQIGATFVPISAVKEMSSKLENVPEYKIPGLVMIDTPGHESFSNLRVRGSDLCDFAILIVDITKALQQQTLESIRLLKERGTPFVIAVTKIDAIFGWKKDEKNAWGPIHPAIQNASFDTRLAIERNLDAIVAAFATEEINVKPFWENDDPENWVSFVPVSSKTGEGIPDLLNLVCTMAQTRIAKQLVHSNALKCVVLEVKHLEGHGTTLDVILVNGELHEGDTIVLSGMSGPVVTKIRALLLPPPLKELRIKSEYVSQKTVRAAMGVKISAPGLQDVLAGSRLLVYRPGKDDLEDLKDEVQSDLQEMLSKLDMNSNGVFVHASSLGSLEALLSFLKESNIPVSGFDIGTVHKASIVKVSTQLEKKRPEYAVLLAFDVKVEEEAEVLAETMGIKIFAADIIYHLKDRCTKHFEEIREQQRRNAPAIFPVALKITSKNDVFHNTEPIIMGVEVINGSLRLGTPLYLPYKNNLVLGKVSSIKRIDKTDATIAGKKEIVTIAIDQTGMQHPPCFGRHFDHTDQIFSHMTKRDIDHLKEFYFDQLTEVDLRMIDKMVELFKIQ